MHGLQKPTKGAEETKLIWELQESSFWTQQMHKRSSKALREQQSQMRKLHRSEVQRGQFQDRAKTLPITSVFWPPAFLYQEYRDTSKQQEIEQRRQRENLSPEVGSGTGAAGSSVAYPPTIQLQLRNNARSLSLWQNLEAVQNSGLLMQLPQKEVIMQEVGCVLET